MLELVRLNNEKLARQLAHVLGREGIRTREEAGDGEFVLFLEDPARHDEAQEAEAVHLRHLEVERDEIGRDVLIIGPRIALLHSVRDESDRFMDDQMADLFGNRGWIAREAADAAARLAERMGCELERVAL